MRTTERTPAGMDPHQMQREFRWASPLDSVQVGVPELLQRGIDPFAFDLPVTGFLQAAHFKRPSNAKLSDTFQENIAREYLALGRGYARAIAAERQVSDRTVVSWVEKARRRGILTRVPAGSYGGSIIPRSRQSGA